MLEVRNLSFDYPEQTMLSNISFSINAGQLLHLRGGNGAGKTTLLRLLAGLLEPAGGEIVWRQQVIRDNLPAYQKLVCYVGHRPGLNLHLTIRENCYFDWHCTDRQYIERWLINFNLLPLADKPCYQLSAGQRRRAALLRIAMTDALIWLLDEPLVALDQQSVTLLSGCLLNHLQKGGLIVMTSHQDLPEELADCMEYVL
ncbi:cytochrome c biogenesis heme-transporting ATPase CcmA [Legionella dresdenensis]|uniref:Cytochrome c biogenesis heme-transporting ATPase CcmA n=1 Tax=Legionella dresdenensis TaxID=450200 RepID=A0ABV8CCR8_9GAMM